MFDDTVSVKKALANYVSNRSRSLSSIYDTEVDQLCNPFPRPPLSPKSLPVPCPLPSKDGNAEPPAVNRELLLGKAFESTSDSEIVKATAAGVDLLPEIDKALNVMCSESHEVYVMDSKFKSFGTLVAANGRAHAIVLVDGMCQPLPFPLKDVVSM